MNARICTIILAKTSILLCISSASLKVPTASSYVLALFTSASNHAYVHFEKNFRKNQDQHEEIYSTVYITCFFSIDVSFWSILTTILIIRCNRFFCNIFYRIKKIRYNKCEKVKYDITRPKTAKKP